MIGTGGVEEERTMSWKTKNFEGELGQIKSANKRKLAEYIIDNLLPDYFFSIRPSSSGKYHPICTLRDGGLVIHTKRLIYFALELANGHQWDKSLPEIIDLIIIAGIIHDAAKKEKYEKGTNDYENHPAIARDMLENKEEELIKYASKKELVEIYNLVLHHMGPWTPEKYRKPLDNYTLPELVLYHADYLASRKYISTPVDEVGVTTHEVGSGNTST